jgi:histidinol-phosphate aminotransferase
MSNWENNVRRVVPYVAGEQPKNQPDMVKLNTNENPYPPSPRVADALRKISADDMRLYPDPAAADLVNAIAEQYQVKPSQVFVGVGSDDVLAMAFQTFFNSDMPILFPDITYSFYDVWADFVINPADYRQKNGGIVFPNPNAPTGLALSLDVIEEILKANPDVVVIVDEAYVDFGARSALSLLDRYENLLVVQTFSKSRALAGMRIGYAIGNEKIIGYLQDVKYSFNSYTMNRTAIALGVAAMEDEAYHQQIVQKIVETREWSKEELRKRGFHFADSSSNFIFARHETIPAKELFEALREKHIYVRYFNKPRIDNYLRITIGTREQMQKLFDFLDHEFGAYKKA